MKLLYRTQINLSSDCEDFYHNALFHAFTLKYLCAIVRYNIVIGALFMGIYYYKLFDILNRKGLKKGDLMKIANISSATVAKLANNKIVQTDIIDRICDSLECQPGDIMEFIPDKEESNQE